MGGAKKLINNPKEVVVEAIDGLVASVPHLRRLDGYPGIKVVVNANSAEKKNKVAVISGGGSGHEPMHAGFVGDGMLDAAVCGEVFASPAVDAIVAAIHAVTGPAGCLLVVKRYTGDRLNFGVAAEKAKAAGLQVEVVVVGEDCALQAKGIAGRRGLAGTILVHKVAGAASSAGCPLAEVKALAQGVADSMGTVGAALSVCTLPGAQASDRLGPGEMEIGLGIHGEPGKEKCPIMPVDELVAKLLGMITAGGGEEGGEHCLNVEPGSRVALLVNNLGATPPMELAIATRAAIHHTQASLKASVARVYSGTLCTSLDMAGVSVTLLTLGGGGNGPDGQKLLTLLDAPTTAPAWPPGSHEYDPSKPLLPVPAAVATGRGPVGRPLRLDQRSAAMEEAIVAAANAVLGVEQELNEYDGKVGDADCGSTLALGARAVLRDVASSYPLGDSEAGTALGLAASMRDMGGTSGALYELFFTGAAGVLAKVPAGVAPTASDAASAFAAGVGSIEKHAGAGPGCRTMVDALHPAAEALRDAAAKGSSFASALKAAAEAAAKGAESTKDMHALAGRSSYVPDEALKGVPDPGAVGVSTWLGAAAGALGD